jgi:NAD(P)-dependent dehydrogenase (short-subunit alcohol dehydrogenase family)
MSNTEQQPVDAALLAGKAAIVTGGASGMGKVMAGALAEAGADVAAVDLNADGLAALADDPMLSGKHVETITLDVSQLGACQDAVARVAKTLGGPDILINCAGVSNTPATQGKPHPVRFWEMDPEGWLRIQLINSAGQYFMAHAAVPHMLAKGWGRIINVTTSFDTMLAVGMSGYGPAKSALEANTVIWAKELADTGVTANVLVPGGPTDTPFLPPEAPRDNLVQPEVMGPPVQWLASAGSDGVTGRLFIARDWDPSLPPADAAERCSSPAAWPDLALQAQNARGRPSV